MIDFEGMHFLEPFADILDDSSVGSHSSLEYIGSLKWF